MATSNNFDLRLKLVDQAIDRHGSSLLAYLTSLTRNPHDATELFDDLWMHVLYRFEEEDITSFGLLRSKARQIFIDWWRKRQRDPVTAVEDLPDTPEQADPFSTPATEEEEQALKENFFSQYDTELSEDHINALWLHAYYGYTMVEIGKITEKPPSTVGDWIRHAREALAACINQR